MDTDQGEGIESETVLGDDPTHEATEIEEIRFRNHHGVECVRYKVTHQRRPALVEVMTQQRLGFLQGIEPLDCFDLKRSKRRVCFQVTSEHVAKRIIVTRLRKDSSPHLVLTGHDLLADYVSEEKERHFLKSYSDFKQLFILYGYTPMAKNAAIASVLVQVVGERRIRGQHVWLFLPNPLDVVIDRHPDGTGAALKELKKLKMIPVKSKETDDNGD